MEEIIMKEINEIFPECDVHGTVSVEKDIESASMTIIPKSENKKEKRRTKYTAGTVDKVPMYIPTITQKGFLNAMTLNQDDIAYIQPISSTDEFTFEKGRILHNGFQAGTNEIKNYYSDEGIDDIDLGLLRVFYGIFVERFVKALSEGTKIEKIPTTVTIYFPDLLKKLGKSIHYNRGSMEACIGALMRLQSTVGIIDNGRRGKDIIPVLVFFGNNVEKNTIQFSCPYAIRILSAMQDSKVIMTDKAQSKSTGKAKMMKYPSHSFLIKSSICNEKNKRAVEIVFIVVTLIERCGNYDGKHPPCIKASTIIARNQTLKQAIEKSASPQKRNRILERAFTKAWELLESQTRLSEQYEKIELPGRLPDKKVDPVAYEKYKKTWIPTNSTLDKVFSFIHKGKKNRGTQQNEVE